ncbi:exs family protein [Lichtheimia corymbifera JMRC:FSU:9682]|uniref:Exs family protein n=1 Tax=Lichtheimia corymbifera JMRC:FSU:9682 TaxID=1263082 RepID=A0A068RZ57_9FUNG|nr:exs family protein [Lichtheimia corymbifera JMRC:FSU:9682]
MDANGTSPMTPHHSLLHSILPAATYRPIVVFCIGLWGWGLNLYLLSRHHIDPAQLLQIHAIDKHSPMHKAVFSLATIITLLVTLNMWWYSLMKGQASTWTPLICYVLALALVLWPGKGIYRKERERFVRVLRRLFSLNILSTVYFADIILADILTSFSNVFGDLFTTGCSALGNPSDNPDACHRDIFVPLLISLPYLIRLRQCISEYLESGGQTKRHLFNALKYASAFPVIIISATQKRADHWIAATGSVPSTWWINDTNLFRLWMFFVFINSMYSFWWDISMDWSLINITTTSPRTHQQTPILRFRRHLHFNDPIWYYAAMTLDFVLRTTWSLKLSSHLYVKRLEGSIFTMELLEVFRRWVWVIFRMENEWVKRATASLPTDNPVLLSMESLQNPPPKLMTIREEDGDDDPSSK